MKIIIKDNDHSLIIPVPTGLIFSKAAVWMYLHFGRLYTNGAVDIPPEAMYALCDEIRRIKRRYGSWELVDVESSKGEIVKIIL